jgi:hypothetical protein
MLMKIMHINHSLNCTILNLQFVPVRRLHRQSKSLQQTGQVQFFYSKVITSKHWTIRNVERTSGHNKAALRKHGRSLNRQHVKTTNFVANAKLILRENRDSVFGIAARICAGYSRWESCQAHRFFHFTKWIWGPRSLLCNRYDSSFPAVKRQWCETDHSPSSSALE